MKISKNLLNLNDDLYLGVIYNPPYRSKYAVEDPYLEIQHEFDRVCSNRNNVLPSPSPRVIKQDTKTSLQKFLIFNAVSVIRERYILYKCFLKGIFYKVHYYFRLYVIEFVF